MMPIRSLDSSYPYQRNQMPSPHYCHPGIEAIPPNVDPSKPPFFYDQRLPYAGNYGHPIPPHICCGHNNFPCRYSYIPSYPHAPSPMYCSGGWPAHSEPYFVPYSPQPNCTIEFPRDMPREHHCCGCLNHSRNQKEGKSVKIEEHEPDGGKKVNDALVPTQLKNYPYPFVWIPQDYTSNKQLRYPNVMEVGEQNKPSNLESSTADTQPAKEPRVLNGWLPFNIEGAPNMIHSGDGIRNQKQESADNRGESEDGKMDQKHQSEQKSSEFPFPIFWLPYYNKLEESGETNNKEKNASSPKVIEELPHTLKSVPVKSHIDKRGRNATGSNQAEYTSTNALDVVEKVSNARSIPVKQIESHKGKNISLNHIEESVTKKDSCTGDRIRQSISSPKGSKLSPVCLRVDPLPMKKNGDGSSSSRSPRQPNTHRQKASANTSEKVKPKEKTIQVSEDKTKENKGVDCKDGCQSQINVNIPNEDTKGTRKTGADGDDDKTEDKKAEKGAETMMEETTELRDMKDSNSQTDEGQKVGGVLSNTDSAVLIQATYRGYQVRKWEPLKKLKQIDEVRKEVSDVRGLVEAFERSSDVQNDDKQKIAIGETIMRLLLKLDTIQGLHPSFREMRKSLARELTILQERLDSITAKKPEQQMQDLHIQKDFDVTPMNMQSEEHVQKDQEEKVAILLGDSSEGDDVKGLCADDGASESQTPVDPTSNQGAEPIVLSNGSNNEDTSLVVTGDALNLTSDLSESDKMAVEPNAKSETNDIPIEGDKLDITDWEELPVGVIDEDNVNVSVEKDEPDDICSEILPAMVYDSAHNEVDLENCEMKLPMGLLDEDERHNEMSISEGEKNSENGIFVNELPIPILDEDTTISEVEKIDRAKPKTSKEALLAQEGECNADGNTRSSTDDTDKDIQLEQQQQLEEQEQEEVQPSAESNDFVKIEDKDEGGLNGDAPMDIGIRTDTELPPLTTQVNDYEPGNGDVCLEADGVLKIKLLPELMEFVPRKEPEEKIVQQEIQEMVAERAISADDKHTETLGLEKTELSVVSPALQELEHPGAKHDGGLNGDLKLLEDSEKLMEMMKRLLEAGNEQFSVISDLTGRVKELEKKLARSRSKRVKTKRYKPATSKMSCMQSS